jgi:hypothetical protein
MLTPIYDAFALGASVNLLYSGDGVWSSSFSWFVCGLQDSQLKLELQTPSPEGKSSIGVPIPEVSIQCFV